MESMEKAARTELRAGDGETPIEARRRLPPAAAFWLRRGERLGNVVIWMATTIAALCHGALAGLRQTSGRITTPPPGEPG